MSKVVTTTDEFGDEGYLTRTEHESLQVSVTLIGPDGVPETLE